MYTLCTIVYGVLPLALFIQITHPSVTGLKIGDKLNIKFLGRDRLGRLVFSRKALLPPPSTSNKTVHALKQEQTEEQIHTLTSEESEAENVPGDSESANKPVG